ncbi:MAG: hypothetical protein ACLGH0_02730, partial [Thermoanaerobaculia bacterium]
GVTATDAPDPVAAGGNITYTGSVTNAGPDAATNTTLSIPLDPDLLFQSITGPAGFTCTTPAVGANGTITCTNASFASGSNVPFTLVAQVNPALESGPDGLIEQTFVISSAVQDPTPANNELTVNTTYTTPDADLSTTNSDSPDPVLPGGTITYTQTATNGGPNAAENATFSETLPASVGFQSIAAPAGWTCATPAIGASGTITCSIASFASGTTANFTVTVEVLASSGTIANTTVVDSDTYDPDNTDNQAAVLTTIDSTPQADLSVSKTTAATNVPNGSTFSYTITVTNDGPADASNPTMTDTLPASLLFESINAPAGWTCTTPAVGATGTITCNATTLADGASAVFTLTVRANGSTGTPTNTATASSATADPNGANGSGSAPPVTLAPASADLGITKTTTATNVPNGSTFSYTISVTNAGPSPASTVTMTDTLPATLLFQSIVAPAGWNCTTPAVGASGTVTCTIATLASGATANFTLTVRANGSTGTVTNSASVMSATADPNGGNGSDDAPPVTLAPASADVSITKTTATTSAPEGSTFSYTIAVTNAGPSAASNVTMTDTLPPGLTFESLVAPPGWACTTGSTITCSIASLASGVTANFTLTVRADANNGTVTNSASVTTSTADPNDGNDSDDAPPVTLAAASADLSIEKSTAATTVEQGDILTYTITVTNSGPSTATGVVVTDTLPSGLQLVTATPSQGTCSGTTTITCNLGTLLNGANATITLQTLVTATSGTISNTASVDGNEIDPDGGDTTSTTPPIPVSAAATAQIPTLSEWMLLLLA